MEKITTELFHLHRETYVQGESYRQVNKIALQFILKYFQSSPKVTVAEFLQAMKKELFIRSVQMTDQLRDFLVRKVQPQKDGSINVKSIELFFLEYWDEEENIQTVLEAARTIEDSYVSEYGIGYFDKPAFLTVRYTTDERELPIETKYRLTPTGFAN